MDATLRNDWTSTLSPKNRSGTMENAGTAAWTLDGRDKMVVEGVQKDGDNYVVNTTETTAEKYWQQISGRAGGNLGITEENLYDATNVRLRNISIAYNLPKSRRRIL